MIAVGVMKACSAALLKLPASATRRKVSGCGLYTKTDLLFACDRYASSKNLIKFFCLMPGDSIIMES